ncbi:hypothetical protein BGZ83_006545 [Gryganskiella cystojenkinii]|nr:hypothetical protein BGZ83_006545 [Gryganskiella cystojenkinii]
MVVMVEAILPPPPVQEMAVMLAGRYLYITGGKYETSASSTTTGATFSLDLSIPWSTNPPSTFLNISSTLSSPSTNGASLPPSPWTELVNGPALNLYNGVALPNNQTLLTFIQDDAGFHVYSYSVSLGRWTSAMPPGMPVELRQGIRPVIDPKTSLVYIAAQYFMDIFDPSAGQLIFPQANIADGYLKSRAFAGAVFNTARRSVMYYGGLPMTLIWESTGYITEYFPDKQSWSPLETKGPTPGARSDHCMAINEDGSTVVIFGGRIPTNTSATPPSNFTSTFFTLDVNSVTWRQGPSADQQRVYMACIIVGTQFIAWGGSDGNETLNGPPIIFDLEAYQWVHHYTPPQYMVDMRLNGNGTGGGNDHRPPSATNLGAILGGVFGALFVITVAGLIYLFKKRRNSQIQYGSLRAQQQLFLPKGGGGGDRPKDPQELTQLCWKPGTGTGTVRNPQDGLFRNFTVKENTAMFNKGINNVSNGGGVAMRVLKMNGDDGGDPLGQRQQNPQDGAYAIVEGEFWPATNFSQFETGSTLPSAVYPRPPPNSSSSPLSEILKQQLRQQQQQIQEQQKQLQHQQQQLQQQLVSKHERYDRPTSMISTMARPSTVGDRTPSDVSNLKPRPLPSQDIQDPSRRQSTTMRQATGRGFGDGGPVTLNGYQAYQEACLPPSRTSLQSSITSSRPVSRDDIALIPNSSYYHSSVYNSSLVANPGDD